MSAIDEDVLITARVHLISSTTVLGAIYGSTFGLYILCARYLYLQLKDPDRRRQNLITLLYMSLVMTCGLLIIAVHALEIQTSYVDHADYPGGGFAYAVKVFSRLPISIMADTISLLLDSLTFGFQIWYLWVIWQASQYALFIAIPPTLALVAYVAFKIAATVIHERSITQAQHMTIYASQALQLSVTIFATVLIIVQLVIARRKHIQTADQPKISGQYTSIIISMLAESYVLQTLWIVITISLQFSQNLELGPAPMFFLTTQSFIQIFSYLLVIYQIVTGRGGQKDAEKKVTTLQFHQAEPRTTQISTRASIPISHEEA